MAIRDPLHKENLIKTEICKASDITAAYLFKKAQCTEFKGLNLNEEDRTQLKKALSARSITPEEISKADNFFIHWYPYWQKANGIEVKELPSETAVKPEQQAPDKTAPQPADVNKPAPITENTIVKENKIIEKEIPVEPEAPTASLKAEMLKNPLTEETPAIDTPESQPEAAVRPEASTTQTQPADKQENEPQPQPIENIETVKTRRLCHQTLLTRLKIFCRKATKPPASRIILRQPRHQLRTNNDIISPDSAPAQLFSPQQKSLSGVISVLADNVHHLFFRINCQ